MQEENPHKFEAERRAAAAKKDELVREAFRIEYWWLWWSWPWTLLYTPGILLGRLTGAYIPESFNVCMPSAWLLLGSFVIVLPLIRFLRTEEQPLRYKGPSDLVFFGTQAYMLSQLFKNVYGIACMPREHLLLDRMKLVQHVEALESLLMDWPAVDEIQWDMPWADRARVEKLCQKLISQLEKTRMVGGLLGLTEFGA